MSTDQMVSAIGLETHASVKLLRLQAGPAPGMAPFDSQKRLAIRTAQDQSHANHGSESEHSKQHDAWQAALTGAPQQKQIEPKFRITVLKVP